jgi:uncharacterized membrane protein (DUF2068 family)
MAKREHAPDYDPSDVGDGRVRRSIAVTAVAVVNLAVGGLFIVLGFLVLVFGLAEFGLTLSFADEQNMTPEQIRQMREAREPAFAVCSMAIGMVPIVAGVGTLLRRKWGRVLGIILGAIALVFAVIDLFSLEFSGAVPNVVYMVIVLGVLLNKQYAAEFR